MSRYSRAIGVMVACGFVLGSGLLARGQDASAPGGKLTAEEIVAYHTKDEKGGTAEAGRKFYEEKCAACHIFGGIGKEVGPDLTTLTSRFKKADILDAIVYPSKVISDQYQAEMIELKDGKVVTGVLVRESAAAVLLRTGDNPDKPVSIPKGQIADRAASPVSLMPEGLLADMTHAQIADLLAFMQAPPPAK